MKILRVKCKDEEEGSAMIATANGMKPYKKGFSNAGGGVAKFGKA